jgi:AcrR family transcriptional regulator
VRFVAPVDQPSRGEQTRVALLDAAAAIVGSDGVGALTLERVAAKAGVSKGGLLYHFKSKQALIGALLVHTLDGADGRLAELAGPPGPGSFARAYLDYVRTGEHLRRGVALGVFASAALEEGELSAAQTRFAAWQERLICADGLSEIRGLLVRVVSDGLWLIDLFGLAPPTEDQRNRLLDLVADVAGGDPQ